MSESNEKFRLLPSVDRVLQSAEVARLIDLYGVGPIKAHTRKLLSELRAQIAADRLLALRCDSEEALFDDFIKQLTLRAQAQSVSSLRPVLNLTGTVVHTNLGRAQLPAEAIAAIASIADQACNLEYDLQQGRRGDRDSHLEQLVCELTGAEAVTVVNNNAAAVLLALNSLAAQKSVLISRGELVEIGGSFRIPDVMRSAHARLVEVGTTNRTHLSDYANAIDKDTGLLLKVHTSNYAVQGFTATVAEAELAQLARQNELPSMADLGSGTLIDMTAYGLPPEPTVQSILESGIDLVTFSGDKLLGGPQAGIIAGKKSLVELIKRNPLKRALRVDKLTIAALEAVLRLYRDPDRLQKRLPLLRDLARPVAEIEMLAESLLPMARKLLGHIATIRVISTHSQIGSGALPLEVIPSVALELTPIAEKGQSDFALKELAQNLRSLSRPIVVRIHDGKLIMDLRCLQSEELLLDLLTELATRY